MLLKLDLKKKNLHERLKKVSDFKFAVRQTRNLVHGDNTVSSIISKEITISHTMVGKFFKPSMFFIQKVVSN